MTIIVTALGCRLMQEQKARRRAHRALAISALVAAHQVSIQQERRREAEDAARQKIAALSAAEEVSAELVRQLSAEKKRRSAAEDAARDKNAALLAAEQLAADLARQNVTMQQEHAAEKDALCAQHAAEKQLARWLITEGKHQLSTAHAQLAQQDEQLRASQAEIARQQAQLTLLPRTMARATELSWKLVAAESAAADANTKLKAERIKSTRLAWVVEQTEHFAETLEALHDCLPHVSEVSGSISSPISCSFHCLHLTGTLRPVSKNHSVCFLNM